MPPGCVCCSRRLVHTYKVEIKSFVLDRRPLRLLVIRGNMATEALIPHIHHGERDIGSGIYDSFLTLPLLCPSQPYTERQEQGSMLCAQHALNALLQGNYYDPSQLADIAKRLDALERTQLDDDAWRSRDTASLNMDDTGMNQVSSFRRITSSDAHSSLLIVSQATSVCRY